MANAKFAELYNVVLNAISHSSSSFSHFCVFLYVYLSIFFFLLRVHIRLYNDFFLLVWKTLEYVFFLFFILRSLSKRPGIEFSLSTLCSLRVSRSMTHRCFTKPINLLCIWYRHTICCTLHVQRHLPATLIMPFASGL